MALDQGMEGEAIRRNSEPPQRNPAPATPTTLNPMLDNAKASSAVAPAHVRNRYVEIKFVKEGMHCYPAAATDPKLKTGDWDDVSFLGTEHFHYFHFVVVVSVTHNDRDIEFIQMRRWCERQYDRGTMNIDHKSCEMLAEELIEKLLKKYGQRYIKVSVYEDNINGGIVEHIPLPAIG